jgi:hypothetical protein
MTGVHFLLSMEHFIKHIVVTKYKTILHLLDNHHSHFSVRVLDLAKENVVVLFSFPFNTDIFNDEDLSPSAVTYRSLQDHKSLESFGFSDPHTSNSNLDVNSQPSTSSLNIG